MSRRRQPHQRQAAGRLAWATLALAATAGSCTTLTGTGSDAPAATPAGTPHTTVAQPAGIADKSDDALEGPSGQVLTDVSDLVKDVERGIVTVTQNQIVLDMASRRPSEIPSGTGTGIVVDEEGHILTNLHVVQGAQTVTVVGPAGSADALVIGRYGAPFDNNDLALLRVDDDIGIRPLAIGSSEALEVGDPVVAIGNALGLGLSVSTGIISAKDRPVAADTITLQDLLQTDAAINPGNSGGPLLNARGEVVGINTAVAGGAENIGWAIPIEQAIPFIEDTLAGARRPYLGVLTLTVTPERAIQFGLAVERGVAILEVSGGTPAALAGLQRGDIVVAVDGVPVTDNAEMAAAIDAAGIGGELDIDVVRVVNRRAVLETFRLTVGER